MIEIGMISAALTIAAQQASRHGGVRVRFFAACEYCKKEPDHLQQESSCKSCGAQLPKKTKL